MWKIIFLFIFSFSAVFWFPHPTLLSENYKMYIEIEGVKVENYLKIFGYQWDRHKTKTGRKCELTAEFILK